MKNELTLGSLFDGSGGFPLGGLLNGITPIWASEIEPFPILVTSKRIPFMKHYGDINTIRGGEIEPVDIITFGSPCTDMSVAGKRAGLDGKQSALFYEAIRIIKEMRCKTNGQYPRYIVWENVPGAFSSNKGEDFKAVLEAVIGIIQPDAEVPSPDKGKWPYADIYLGDGWSLAYRTIDAQFFGVAQRRRRIYLVADFRSECAGEILFECKGMSRNFAPSFSEREGTATDAENSTGETSIVLNDQGGSYIECSKDIAAALRAEAHGHLPCVMQPNIAGAVCFEPGAVSRIGGHAYENKCGSLRAGMGDNQIAVALENHPTDSRLKIDESGTVQTLTSRMGTGGMNVPLVMGERIQGLPVSENLAQTLMGTDYKGVQCVCQSVPRTLKLRSGCEGGGKGALVQEDISATLGCNNDQTVFVPTVYGICSDNSNAMKSNNPDSGIYEAETSRTIDQCGGNPSCHQGGMAVVSIQGSMIGRNDKNGPQGDGVNENISFTLNTADRHAIAYGLDPASYNQGENAEYDFSIAEEKVQTAHPYLKGAYSHTKDGINEEYTVRRLTPTECARLQGFPDNWCSNLETVEPTQSTIDWWSGVFETYRKVIGNSTKIKSRNQIIKWLKNPCSDSAEYKMWGNGVALPCVCFVMRGIALVNNKYPVNY